MYCRFSSCLLWAAAVTFCALVPAMAGNDPTQPRGVFPFGSGQNAQSSYDSPADVQDNFQDFIDRHPRIRNDALNGTVFSDQATIVHVNGCVSNCQETVAHWAARHEDAIRQYQADHAGQIAGGKKPLRDAAPIGRSFNRTARQK